MGRLAEEDSTITEDLLQLLQSGENCRIAGEGRRRGHDPVTRSGTRN